MRQRLAHNVVGGVEWSACAGDVDGEGACPFVGAVSSVEGEYVGQFLAQRDVAHAQAQADALGESYQVDVGDQGAFGAADHRVRVTVTSQGVEELHLVTVAETTQYLVFPPFDSMLTALDHSHDKRVPDAAAPMPGATMDDGFAPSGKCPPGSPYQGMIRLRSAPGGSGEHLMSLTDDIVFYGRAVDAGELPRTEAVRLLVSADSGMLSVRVAGHLVYR